jgi:gas vesicle protein
MAEQDTADFLTAFAVGTVLGIGATLLLQPMKRSYGKARKAVRHGAGATSEMSSEVFSASGDLLSEFRDEVASILGDARADLQEMISDQAGDLSKSVRKARRKYGV